MLHHEWTPPCVGFVRDGRYELLHQKCSSISDDFSIIVTGAPRPNIDVDQLAKVIVDLALKLAAQAAGGASSSAKSNPESDDGMKNGRKS